MDVVMHLVADPNGRALDDDCFDSLSEQYGKNFDGLLSRRGNQLLITVYLDWADVGLESAAISLIDRVQSVMDVEVRELDLDLVTISDIAQRTGRTRQGIRMLVDGVRGAGGFPPSLGLPGGSRVWDWNSVNQWLTATTDLGDAESGLSRSLIYKINASIAGRACAEA